MTKRKNSGDDVGFNNLDKSKWKNPPTRPVKLIPNPPVPLPPINP